MTVTANDRESADGMDRVGTLLPSDREDVVDLVGEVALV